MLFHDRWIRLIYYMLDMGRNLFLGLIKIENKKSLVLQIRKTLFEQPNFFKRNFGMIRMNLLL